MKDWFLEIPSFTLHESVWRHQTQLGKDLAISDFRFRILLLSHLIDIHRCPGIPSLSDLEMTTHPPNDANTNAWLFSPQGNMIRHLTFQVLAPPNKSKASSKLTPQNQQESIHIPDPHLWKRKSTRHAKWFLRG